MASFKATGDSSLVSYVNATQVYNLTHCSGVMGVTVRRQLSSAKECSWYSTHSGRPSLGLLAP